MLREHSGADAVIINILLGALWHYITYIVCITAGNSFFDPAQQMYKPRKWDKAADSTAICLRSINGRIFFPSISRKTDFLRNTLTIQAYLILMNS